MERNLSESMPMSPTTRVPGDTSAEAGPSRNTSQDFDNVVRGNGHQYGKRDPRRSGANTPTGLGGGAQAHTYPPDARPSVDAQSTNPDDGQVLAQAAKALKMAVLHDARNIKGKDTTEAEVSFTITSPHEAKVRSFHWLANVSWFASVHRSSLANATTFFFFLLVSETRSKPLLCLPCRQETDIPHPI